MELQLNDFKMNSPTFIMIFPHITNERPPQILNTPTLLMIAAPYVADKSPHITGHPPYYYTHYCTFGVISELGDCYILTLFGACKSCNVDSEQPSCLFTVYNCTAF